MTFALLTASIADVFRCVFYLILIQQLRFVDTRFVCSEMQKSYISSLRKFLSGDASLVALTSRDHASREPSLVWSFAELQAFYRACLFVVTCFAYFSFS